MQEEISLIDILCLIFLNAHSIGLSGVLSLDRKSQGTLYYLVNVLGGNYKKTNGGGGIPSNLLL